MVSGVHGESARAKAHYLSEKSLATLAETINSDDCVLYHEHRMCQSEEHQSFFVSHKLQQKSTNKVSEVSHSADLVVCRRSYLSHA